MKSNERNFGAGTAGDLDLTAIRSLFEQAARGETPADSPCWTVCAPEKFEIKTKNFEVIALKGQSLAYLACCAKQLPSDFEGWAIQNNDVQGTTVAQLWVAMGGDVRFPLDIANRKGQTIAHMLVGRLVGLPDDFTNWDWADHDGITVIDEARKQGNVKVVARYEAWQLRQAVGEATSAARISRSHL